MKKYALLVALFIALFAVPNTSHAGFIVKRKAAQTEVAAVKKSQDKLEKQERRQQMFNTILSLMPHEGDHERTGKHKDHSGWEGTASMWCAIGGFFYFPPALIVALVFAGMGLKPGKRHRNRAIAGLVIAISGIFFWAIMITATLWAL